MKNKIRYTFILSLVVLLCIFIYKFVLKRLEINSSKYLISYMVDKFDYINIKEDKDNNKNNILPKDIIKYSNKFIYYIPKKIDDDGIPAIKQETFLPTVYIYNTHNKEKYYHSNTEAHNIIPTVLTTSYMLREKLKEYNIDSLVEEEDISQILKRNNWKYASSYRASRTLLEKVKTTYPSLKFFIDVHRDSVKKEISTVEINKKNYARILFIVGLENKNYERNLELTKKINDLINREYKGLSRGIYKKDKSLGNGVYNQDFSSNSILIEFGGEKNSIEEVYNSVEAVGDILAKIMGE